MSFFSPIRNRLALSVILVFFTFNLQAQLDTARTIKVELAAINQPWMFNRLGASQPTGLIYALLSDIEPITGTRPGPGNARLREGKRARPIVIRANMSDKIQVTVHNFLPKYVGDDLLDLNKAGSQIIATYDSGNVDSKLSQKSLAKSGPILPPTRPVGFHVMGMEYESSLEDGGSFVGTNSNALVDPGKSKTYTFIAEQHGTFIINSMGDVTNHTISGLFGSVTVQPQTAEYYRSQTSREDLFMATKYWINQENGKTVYYDYAGKPSSTPIPTSRYATRLSYAAVKQYVNLTQKGYPVIDYNAQFPVDHPLYNKKRYILRMLDPDTHELLYSDLTAVITGPNQGEFTYTSGKNTPLFLPIPATPNRQEPYREIVVHYHEVGNTSVQAFPEFYNPLLSGTISSGFDNFAINYSTAGISAEIYANRIGVGPMSNCVDCEYEEFFLSSWPDGDPSMVVDVPANVRQYNKGTDFTGNTLLGLSEMKANSGSSVPLTATKAYFPDDPSNVYHSYIWDHVQFRIGHTGVNNPHVHHQHAHQWLHSQNSDNGHYLDSQVLSPAGTYTLEMVYNGSGNKNLTPGDQIFHCHFYPHFAAGMWALWRVHDVLEVGTELDEDGMVVKGARALPDAEIMTGTPIPAVVPLPTKGMAPIPGAVEIQDGQVVVKDTVSNPGFPFFIPGYAGSRPPQPPLDFAIENEGTAQADTLDGGLPRHVVVGGEVVWHRETRYDWTKMTGKLDVVKLPFAGTPVEKVAMAFHAKRFHDTFRPDGSVGRFTTNGQPPVAGAPYADPAVDIEGHAEDQLPRTYKAAVMQMDVVFNREGWHYPQQRFISLWGDVSSTVQGIRPPQPFFFRVNSDEYVNFWHTNLVPQYYELDAFQVRTPTDIIGQHIHLVKFDVTSSDGAENGYNYEDGTFSPDAVQETIRGINDGIKDTTKNKTVGYRRYAYSSTKNVSYSTDTITKLLIPKPANPVWGTPPADQTWDGAQTTVQRWYADSLLNNAGFDRTLRTVFSHDHFSPSTHQQIGLYAGMLIEPASSKWYNPNTGSQLGIANNGATREVEVTTQTKNSSSTQVMSVSDGGPTDWQANIVTTAADSSYREFALEFQDRALTMYPIDNSIFSFTPYPQYETLINDPTSFLDSAEVLYHGWLPPGVQADVTGTVLNQDTLALSSPSTPNVITASPMGTYTVNYRNELLSMRVHPNLYGNINAPISKGAKGDLVNAFSSDTVYRENPAYKKQPKGLVNFGKKGLNVRFPEEPLTAGMLPGDPFTPLMRAYAGDKVQIRTLVGGHQLPHYFSIQGQNWLFEPSYHNSGYKSTQYMGISEHFEMIFDLPRYADKPAGDYLWWADAGADGVADGMWGILRYYSNPQDSLVALPNNPTSGLTAAQTEFNKNFEALKRSSETVTFNVVATTGKQALPNGQVVYNRAEGAVDNTALLFVLAEDLDNNGRLKPGVPIEPLILRANAGQFININLRNDIDSNLVKGKGYTLPISLYATKQDTGTFHPQNTTVQTSGQVSINAQLLEQIGGGTTGYNIGTQDNQTIKQGETATYSYYAGKIKKDGTGIPVEFGPANLIAPDPFNHFAHGLFGAIIIEPADMTGFVTDPGSRAMATVTTPNETFRELVLIYQDQNQGQYKDKATKKNSTIDYAFNYSKASFKPGSIDGMDSVLMDKVFANVTYGADPETPVFAVKAGHKARFRLAHTGGTGFGQDQSFLLHGHVWQEEPHIKNGTVLGNNPESNWMGSRIGIGALAHYNILIDKAGGNKAVAGDYLYRSWYHDTYSNGQWGLMRVTEGDDAAQIMNLEQDPKCLVINGNVTVSTVGIPTFTEKVKVRYKHNESWHDMETDVNAQTGVWQARLVKGTSLNNVTEIILTTTSGANRTYHRKELQDNIKHITQQNK